MFMAEKLKKKKTENKQNYEDTRNNASPTIKR